jgi:ER lumen protein retaining receptor
MDIFQLIGDFLHLFAIFLLLLKIVASKNVVGLSYKTQEIYLIVFLTRYSDLILESHWGSVYFNIMRIVFIGITGVTIYYMRYKRPYKLVWDWLCRVMIRKQIVFHIIICIWYRLFWDWLCIRNGRYLGYFKHFLGGLKL